MKRLLCPNLLLCWFLFVERVSSFCPGSAISKPPTLRLRHVTQSTPGLLVTPPLQDRLSTPKFPTTKLYSSTAFSLSSSSGSVENDAHSTRSKLRQITGFSLTAFRATIRGVTGISLSQVISNTIRRILGVLRPGFRWILQPLLIVYYVPIMVVRYYLIGPSQQYVEDSRKGHEKLVDGWRKAVEAAEKAHADGYWPVHLNDDGSIVAQLPPDPADVFDVTDGIEKSVAENFS